MRWRVSGRFPGRGRAHGRGLLGARSRLKSARMTKSEIGIGEQTRAAQKHPAKATAAIVTDTAIRALEPSGSRRAIRALFDNRVTWHAIQHWRNGRRIIPQWAVDMLTPRLRAKAQLADQLDQLKRIDKGQIGAEQLRKLRAQKAKIEPDWDHRAVSTPLDFFKPSK